MPTLYLLYVRGGELAGLERGSPLDALDATREARRLLARDVELAAVEIWRDGELLGAVRG